MLQDIIIGLLIFTCVGLGGWIIVIYDRLEQRVNYARRLEREIAQLKSRRSRAASRISLLKPLGPPNEHITPGGTVRGKL